MPILGILMPKTIGAITIMAKNRVDPLANYMPVNLHEAEALVIDTFQAGWVPNLISSPGIGKSSLIKQIAKKQNLKVVDVRLSQLDPADLNGFPHIYKDAQGNQRAGYVPMNIFPIEGDPLPVRDHKSVITVVDVEQNTIQARKTLGDPYQGWILFLDEYNAATPNVQAAAYKIVLDKLIGMHPLHKKCLVATAGNLMTDKAIVNRQSTATQSRIAHIVIRVCNDTWHWWADKYGIDPRVKAFLKFKPALLHAFDPNHTDLTFPCPRTWEMTSDIVTPMKDKVPMSKLPLLAGCVGVGAAREFHSFTEVFNDLPSITEIINNPEGIPLRDEPSVHFALSGLIGHHMKPDNAQALIKFLNRLGADFQVITLRQAIARDINLLKSEAIMTWLKFNTQELIRGRV